MRTKAGEWGQGNGFWIRIPLSPFLCPDLHPAHFSESQDAQVSCLSAPRSSSRPGGWKRAAPWGRLRAFVLVDGLSSASIGRRSGLTEPGYSVTKERRASPPPNGRPLSWLRPPTISPTPQREAPLSHSPTTALAATRFRWHDEPAKAEPRPERGPAEPAATFAGSPDPVPPLHADKSLPRTGTFIRLHPPPPAPPGCGLGGPRPGVQRPAAHSIQKLTHRPARRARRSRPTANAPASQERRSPVRPSFPSTKHHFLIHPRRLERGHAGR